MTGFDLQAAAVMIDSLGYDRRAVMPLVVALGDGMAAGLAKAHTGGGHGAQ